MNTDFSDLSIMQMSDSFFPTGLYTMSNGLETLFDEKQIQTADQLEEFIAIIISQQIGPADCVALSSSYDFATVNDIEKIIECDKTLYSMKLVKESRDAICRSGSQMLKCVKSFMNNDLLNSFYNAINESRTPATHPVVISVCSNILGIKKESAMMMLLYGFTVSTIGAALRLGLIDHIQSQKILHNLKPHIMQTIEKFIMTPLESMWQFTPEYDLIQMSHEQKFSKMFIT
tara:strand:- start:151 stop:843 length:693 start_codon:yes stop_codon:yes gene_type:complete